MAFCPNCGANATGRFCPNCGTDVGGTGSAYTSSGPSRGAFSAGGLSDNVASALCYLLIPAIIFLLIDPYRRNRMVRFHAFQAIFAYLGLIVLRIILRIITNVFLIAHAWWLSNLIWSLFDLAILVGWIYLMYMAFNNRKIRIPVISDLADKQA